MKYRVRIFFECLRTRLRRVCALANDAQWILKIAPFVMSTAPLTYHLQDSERGAAHA